MKTKIGALLAISLLLAGLKGNAQEAGWNEYIISKGYAYQNLTVFFVKADMPDDYDHLVTLDQAIQEGMVKVFETQDVDELSIQNFSSETIFIQAGDIVKGGKQDRVIPVDLILPPKSERMPLASFCVEHGRWAQRGDEDLGEFSSSTKRISSKELKLAAIRDNSQQEVWEKVEVVQDNLSVNMGVSVEDSRSASSMQLTLENEELTKLLQEFIEWFNDQYEDQENVTGMVFAINGEINSADIYNSNGLFAKLWPRLVEAAATEAIEKQSKTKTYDTLSASGIAAWLEQSEDTPKRERKDFVYSSVIISESPEFLVYQCFDMQHGGSWVHLNIIQQ